MNFPPPLPLLFFIDARLKGKAEEKNQREKKAITSVKNLRQEEIISMFEFTSLQFSVIFTLFFCSLVVKSMMMVWLKAKAIAINVCKFSLSLPFRINLTFSCSLYFHATTLFYELSHMHTYKKSSSLHVKFKTFSLSCHATQKFLQLQFWTQIMLVVWINFYLKLLRFFGEKNWVKIRERDGNLFISFFNGFNIKKLSSNPVFHRDIELRATNSSMSAEMI